MRPRFLCNLWTDIASAMMINHISWIVVFVHYKLPIRLLRKVNWTISVYFRTMLHSKSDRLAKIRKCVSKYISHFCMYFVQCRTVSNPLTWAWSYSCIKKSLKDCGQSAQERWSWDIHCRQAHLKFKFKLKWLKMKVESHVSSKVSAWRATSRWSWAACWARCLCHNLRLCV